MKKMSHQKPKAVLLMGPTGVGKSPLGDLIEKQGFNNRRCFHFDFGRNLRRAASGTFSKDFFPKEDVDFIRQVLASGTLLENETFFIAEKIFKAFIADKGVSHKDRIILNGLPRHIDQADDTALMVEFQSVMVLECAPEAVFERIRLNSGGDRTARVDDGLDKIKHKLEIFTSRTLPLLKYFSDRNILIKSVHVDVHTKPEQLFDFVISDAVCL